MKRAMKKLGEFLLTLIFLWALAGITVFWLRHPWATMAETFVRFPEVITFQKVPYDHMRPRT